MRQTASFTSAIFPLQNAVKRRWPLVPELREQLSRIPPPQEDPVPYTVVLEAIGAEYVLALLSSHALCEALINCTLALALATKSQAEIFHLIERSDFFEKWTVAPRLVADKYSLDKKGAIYETMRRLNTHRNSYLHNKAAITTGDQLVFEGSKTMHKGMADDLDWMHRYISLPFDLADHLKQYENLALPSVVLDRQGIPRAPQHKS